jgi:UDP-glucose 4-epimerase
VRVLVTGASGVIGRHTVAQLLDAGHTVRTFHRGPAVPDAADHVAGDVCEPATRLQDAARDCQAVVHLAGRGDVAESRRDPYGYAELNATGALRALEAARCAGAAFVLASTQRVYPLRPAPCREDDPPTPDSPYGFAKLAAELWCKMESELYGVPTTVLRFFSVYGPWQQPNGGSGVVTIFARAALAGQPLEVQSAGRRDLTDARDAARGIQLALEQPARGFRVINLATGRGTTFRELADLVVEVCGSRSPVIERVAEPPGRDLVADISLAQSTLGFEPEVSLREGLERYVAWLRSSA